MTAEMTTTGMTIRGGELMDAIASIRPALIARKSAQPWECGVRLQVGPTGATLACATGEVSMKVDLAAHGEADVWVDGNDLWKAVGMHAARRGKRAHIELALTVEDARVKIAGESGASTVAVLDREAMLAPMEPVKTTWVTDREEFVGHAAAAAVCADTDDYLPILKALHIHEGKMEATDRYRLTVIDLRGTGSLPQVIVPAALFVKVLKSATGQTLSLGANCERVTVHGEGFTLTMRCLEGEYPKVKRIADDAADSTAPSVMLDRSAVIATLKAFGTRDIVTLTPTDGTLLIYVRATHQQETAMQVTLPTQPGDTLTETTAFNAKYLREILQATPGDLVKMESRAPHKPAAFIGDDPDRVTVLQPVRIAG